VSRAGDGAGRVKNGVNRDLPYLALVRFRAARREGVNRDCFSKTTNRAGKGVLQKRSRSDFLTAPATRDVHVSCAIVDHDRVSMKFA